MKYPALARVFAAVLAILGLILLFTGVRGFGKAGSAHAERLAFAERYAGRIEKYSQLHEKMENAADYDETMTALKRFLEKHEKAASKHKTDTAIFTSTKGGLKMGEDMIVAARTQMNEIREQLKSANSRKAFLESLLTELIASNKSKMPWLDALANTAAQYAVDSYMGDAKLTVTTEKLRALMDAEPSLYDLPAFEPPEMPAMPELPRIDAGDGASYEAMQSAYQSAMIQAQSAFNAYQQAGESYVQDMQRYYDNMAHAQIARLNRSWDQVGGAVSNAAYSVQYEYEHALWEKECENVKKEVDFGELSDEIRRLSAAFTHVIRQANRQMAALSPELGEIYDGMEELVTLANDTADRLDALRGSDPSKLSNEEFLLLVGQAQEVFQMLGDAYSTIASNLNNPAVLIAEVLEKLHIAQALAKMLDGMLEKAEQQMQAALEEMWYQLGETEKDKLKLEAEKLGLDREAALLSRDTMQADELKELRNNHSTARQLLLSVPEVRKATDQNDNLADNARDYLKAYERETEKLRLGRFAVCLFAVLGGVAALAGIPAAYELLRQRFLLIAPPAISLLCSAGAAALDAALGIGQMYSAIAVAIFALVQLLIVLPRRKRAQRRPMHLM